MAKANECYHCEHYIPISYKDGRMVARYGVCDVSGRSSRTRLIVPSLLEECIVGEPGRNLSDKEIEKRDKHYKSQVENAPRECFAANLKQDSRVVESWAPWKRNILGPVRTSLVYMELGERKRSH